MVYINYTSFYAVYKATLEIFWLVIFFSELLMQKKIMEAVECPD